MRLPPHHRQRLSRLLADGRPRIPVGGNATWVSVLLLDAAPNAVDLTGWTIADRMVRACPLPTEQLAAGAVLQAPITAPTRLENQGGSIRLLVATGLKLDGVTYTEDQARREGWMIA
ncbi:MAG: hypothetical protein QOF37_3153 [Thermoleophilaceae bacterium]|jgi:hypothetical protein|nr:hypothetical protein [Thermoleophilaceae bacterium]